MPRGRPRKVPASVSVTPDHEHDSSVLRFRRAVGEVLGANTHIHLAAIRLKPARLAELAVGRPRFTPLRWSDLNPEQVKALTNLVPNRGADDLVMYGDTCVVTCPEAEWQAELRRKDAVNQKQLAQELADAGRLSRDTGVQIDTQWEEIGAQHVPGSTR